jgi:hypothetical protein
LQASTNNKEIKENSKGYAFILGLEIGLW